MQESTKYTFDFVINEMKTRSIHDKYPYSHAKKTGGKIINMSLGRIFFNEKLPEDYPLVDEPVNQSKILAISKDLTDKYPPDVTSRILTDLQRDFYQIGTLSPSTFNVNVFIPKDDWLVKKKEFEKRAGKLNPADFQKEAQELNELLQKAEKNKSEDKD